MSSPPIVPNNIRLTAAPSSVGLVQRARRTRIVILALALGVAWAILPFLPGLLGAGVLTVLAAPTHRSIAARVGERTSALLLSIGLLLLLVVPALLLLAAGIQQAPAALHRVVESRAFARLAAVQIGTIDIGVEITGAGRNAIAWVSGHALGAAGTVTETVLNLLIGFVGLYYLLPKRAAVWGHVRRLIPFPSSEADDLAERFTSITRAALLSIAATALSQGLTVGLAFALVGLPNPFFWGVATGMASILPILGSALIWLPGVIVLLLDDHIGAAITLGLIGLVICSNVDNIIRLFIFRRMSGVHPMASLVGAFAGVKVLGILGIFLGPLALTYCLELFALHEAEFDGSG